MISTLEAVFKDVDGDELGLKAEDGFVFLRTSTGWNAHFLQYPSDQVREIGKVLIALADLLDGESEATDG